MTKKLYVGNLPYSFDESSLKEVFADFGTVTSAKVITDMNTGRSKGFGFIEMGSPDEANAAVEGLNSKEVGGRSLKVDLAKAKEGGPGGRDGFKGERTNSFRGDRNDDSRSFRGESRNYDE